MNCPKCRQPVPDDVNRCTNIPVGQAMRCDQLLEERIFHRKQVAESAARGKVFESCKELFRQAMRQSPRDSLIGLITTDDFTFYLAPCFGVKPCPRCGQGPLTDNDRTKACERRREHTRHMMCVTPEKNSPERSLKDVLRTYRREAILIQLLPTDYDNHEFKSQSHTAFLDWVNRRTGTNLRSDLSTGDDAATMGFSIQHEGEKSFIRFASGRNEKFTPRLSIPTALITRGYKDGDPVPQLVAAGRNAEMFKGQFSTASVQTAGRPPGQPDPTDRSPALSGDPNPDVVLFGRNYTGKMKHGMWEMKAERDMPKAWFEWGCAVLARDLNLQLTERDRYESRLAANAREGSTKRQYFVVSR